MSSHPEHVPPLDPDRPARDFLDLGNGEAACSGTAADMLAAAAWLEEHYPEDQQRPDQEAD